MPIGLGAATLIGAGIGAAGNATSAISAGKMNKRSMKFQREMFHETNKYNAPKSQMQRLQDAGLNPNLVYGGSSGGTAGTASQPAKPDFNVPDWGPAGQAAASGINQYYNIKSVQAGIDVNEARAENIKQNTVNQGIDAVTKAINASSGAIDFKTKQRLFENNIATAEQRLKNLGIEGTYTQSKNSREERIATETINNLKKTGKNLSEENIMREIDRKLYQKYKIRPQDPIYYRIMGQAFDWLKENSNPIKLRP